MMNNINVNTWHNYRVRDIFKKIKLKKYGSQPEIEGETPFVTSSSVNNGVSAFVGEDPVASNVITVSTNGACFDCFYHDEPIVISTDVEVLFNDNLNRYNALFICTVLKLEKKKYSYGRKPKNNKVFDTIIKLPYKSDNEPDREYMTNYVKLLWGGCHQTSIPYCKININTETWKSFKLKDIFEIYYGINMELCNLENAESNVDGVNFVSRTEVNNGISAKVKIVDGKIPQESGLITVAGGGSVLSTFLQTEPFYSGRDLYILKSKENLSNLAKLFICTIIKKNKYKYNYGRQANKTLSDLIIKLPANEVGNPDYCYMENFMKKMQFSDLI